ncbi:MAG: hypothetical protein OXF45_05625 [Candidatus Dadabacteria bacterium]|nr:hypothetical protein [Candidatus Dadabacteria bacterium]
MKNKKQRQIFAFILRLVGLIFAFILILVALIGSFFLVSSGHDYGAIFDGVSLVQLESVFITGRRPRKEGGKE